METIKVKIGAEDNTAAAFKSVESRMQVVAKTGDLVNRTLAGIGSALTVGALVNVGRAALNTAADIDDMSQRLGISTEALSQYQHVAKMSGTDFEALTTAIKLSQRAVSEAASGAKSATDALAGVGLAARDLADMSPEAAFEAIGDAISKLPSAADKTNASMKLFGRSGTDLIPVFRDGADGIRAMREEADRLGLTLDQLSANKAAKALDAVDRLSGSFSAMARDLAITVAPQVEAVAQKLTDSMRNVEVRGWIATLAEDERKYWQARIGAWNGYTEGMAAAYEEMGRRQKATAAALAGLFNLPTGDAPLLPGLTREGVARAAEYSTQTAAAMNRALKSVEVATDGLTAAESRYFQQLEASVQKAQQRQMTGPYDLDESDLMELDSVAAQRHEDERARYLEWLAEATDRFRELQRQSSKTWQVTNAGIDMVTDQLSNNLAAAIAGAQVKLLDLASIAESLLAMAFRFALQAGFAALTGVPVPLPTGIGPTPSGVPMGKAMGAIPGPADKGGHGVTINGGVTLAVKGTIDPNDRMTIRRTANAIYDELLQVQKHHGPLPARA